MDGNTTHAVNPGIAYKVRVLLGLCDAHVHPLDDIGVLHAAVNVERKKRAPNYSAKLIAERRLAASGLA